MATSGAYSGQSFSFNYSFVDAATPTQFFSTDLSTSDITIYSRTGSSTGAGANIASAPTRTGTLFTFTLSSLEMTGDEVIVQVTASGMVPETISIALQPTPSDISEVTQTAVSGISDFQGSGGGSTGPTEAEIYTYFTSSSRQDTFKANVGGLATASALSTLSSDVGDIETKVDSLDLGITTIDNNVDAILVDTNELQNNQGNWLTATGFSTFDPASDTVTTDTASRNASKADVSSLATQASVDSVDTDIQNIGSDVSAILTDTNDLQTNQGNWLTATGFSTHSATDVRNALQAVANDFKATGFSTFDHTSDQVVASNMRGTDGAVTTPAPTAADVYTYFTDGSRENVFKATGFATVNPDNASISAILADTNELQQNQGDWATATGFSTHDQNDVVNAMLFVAGDFKADVSGLSTFDPASDTVTVGTNNDKTGYVLTQAFPSNFSNLIIGTGGDAGKVTTSNPAAGSGSAHTAQDVANLILETPANKLATDSSGRVTAENMRGTDGANTTAPDNASIAAILADTNELQGNQGDWATATGFSTHSATDVRNALQAVSGDFKANVSGLATQSSVNTVDSNVDAIKAKTDQLAFTVANQVDANALTGGGGGGGGGDDAATIYTYFTAGSREDVFKADVSGLSTFDPSTDEVTTDTDSRNASKANVSTLASQSSVTAIDNVVDAIKVKTDQLTFSNPGEVDANAVSGGGGGGATASEVYTYFTDGSREDVFKADVSNLSTFDPGTQTVTTDSASRAASKADVSGLSTFNASTDTVTTDTASREASKANVSGLATAAQINGLNDFDPSSQDVTFSAAQAQALADEVLKRSVSNTQDSADAHSLAAIVLGILESQRTGASWTIRKTDGSTFATKSLTLDSGASPVTGVD